MIDLRLFTHNGILINHIDKEIEYLLRSVEINSGDVIIVYGCSDGGHLGVVLANKYPANFVYIIADNLRDSQIAEGNIKENKLGNIEVYIGNDLDFLQSKHAIKIVMRPSRYEGNNNVRLKMINSHHELGYNGKFYLLAHMRQGASSLIEILDEVFGNYEILDKGGGGIRVIRSVKTDYIERGNIKKSPFKIIETVINGRDYKFQTHAGLFSKDRIDKGTVLLLENVKLGNAQTVLDLGCGYGVIGIVTAGCSPDTNVLLLDIDAQAIKYSLANIQLNQVSKNASVVMSDGFRELKGIKFDLIVSHFPLHVPKSKQAELLLGAKNALNPNGRFYLVALSSYNLQFLVQNTFGNVDIIANTTQKEDPSERYFVLCANNQFY